MFRVWDVLVDTGLTAQHRYSLLTAGQEAMEAIIGLAIRIRTGSVDCVVNYEKQLSDDKQKLLKRKIVRLPYRDYIENPSFRPRAKDAFPARRGGYGQQRPYRPSPQFQQHPSFPEPQSLPPYQYQGQPRSGQRPTNPQPQQPGWNARY